MIVIKYRLATAPEETEDSVREGRIDDGQFRKWGTRGLLTRRYVITKVQADGDELLVIYRRFVNLPGRDPLASSVTWRGDLAYFILDNLPQEFT